MKEMAQRRRNVRNSSPPSLVADFARELGEVIRAERKRQRIGQEELALLAGVSRRLVVQIENGKPTARLDSVLRICNALGIRLVIRRPGTGP